MITVTSAFRVPRLEELAPLLPTIPKLLVGGCGVLLPGLSSALAAQECGRQCSFQNEDWGVRCGPRTAVANLTSLGSSCSFFPDLHAAFNIICDNVGKDWKRLARRLGVPDAKMDGIEERYPRNLMERVRESLRVWKNSEREKATVARLVEALRACQMNLVADLVEEEQQARGLQDGSDAVSPMRWDSDTHPSGAP
uniref:Death domain-containing protein n=1 Tax=Sciurus vulgaris TaxID=55149 RepID=A0A8D2DMA8_SCIVU